jgi:hypothetical protein
MTVTRYLARLNEDDRVMKNNAGYMQMLKNIDSDGVLYAAADRVSNWYKRNLRMFANINRITGFASRDRVLLIVGSGHLRILKQLPAMRRSTAWSTRRTTCDERPSLARDGVVRLDEFRRTGVDADRLEDRHQRLSEALEILMRVPHVGNAQCVERPERNVKEPPLRRAGPCGVEALDDLVILL